jgi:hypothetical protein
MARGERGGRPRPQSQSAAERQIVNIAEGLGTFLGEAEAQWNAWRGERERIVKSLTEIRDRATRLLSDVGGAVQNGAAQLRRRGRPVGSKNTPKTRPAKRGKKKGGLSPEGRAAIVAAQKARWAAIKADNAKRTK